MKIYFTGAVSNVAQEYRDRYEAIVKAARGLGHTVYAEHLEGKDRETLKKQKDKDALDIQKKLTSLKKQADLVLVEGSNPSFGVGQEIAEALSEGKQVIVLHTRDRKPHILSVGGESSLYIVEYTDENMESQLEEYIEYARTRSDTRFNFFISPAIGYYLDWIAKKKRIPRAVYLRRLIENEMKDNKEYAKEA